MTVSVLGSGSWGTALAWLLGQNGHDVLLLGRNEAEIDGLRSNRINDRYLPGVTLPDSVRFGFLADEPVPSDFAVLAVPSSAARQIAVQIHSGTPIVVIAAKGLEANESRLLTDVVSTGRPQSQVGVLSGPNLAVEIVKGIPTVAIAAFADERSAEQIRNAFSSRAFRVSTSDDVIGVELAGALKNVLAIGAGMSDGLGFGDNTKGAFLSRGLLEMARLGVAMGGRLETFLGPAGVGDLFATAASTLSRNYRLGLALGQGVSLGRAIENLQQVAEGATTAPVALQLANAHEVEVPVMAAVDAVVGGRLTPAEAVGRLMERGIRTEDFR